MSGYSPHDLETWDARIREQVAALLERIDRRVLWLASRMIHEASVVRLSPDGLKVGGHQASSASSVSP